MSDGDVNTRVVKFDKNGRFIMTWGEKDAYLLKFARQGTFVKEAFVARKTLGSGSVWDIGFSTDPAQTFLVVPDGTNQQIWILRRDTLQVVSAFGRAGRWAGQFYGAHNLAIDAKGNLFITETYEGKRVQKFVYRGLGPASVPTIQ